MNDREPVSHILNQILWKKAVLYIDRHNKENDRYHLRIILIDNKHFRGVMKRTRRRDHNIRKRIKPIKYIINEDSNICWCRY